MSALPFIKWLGSKRQLVPELARHVPEKFGTYYEPFAGAAALFFHLQPKRAVLNDSLEHLARTYIGVRSNVEEVIEELDSYSYDRDEYNAERARTPESLRHWDDEKLAAWFIYINRTCFNGVWRVNRKTGVCNVPMGSYKNPTICDAPRLRECSRVLRAARTVVRNVDFQLALRSVEQHDLVYMDPPYWRTSSTADFAGYTADGFTWLDQKRVADEFVRLRKLGAHVLMTNADVAPIHALWSSLDILYRIVQARRSVNSKVTARGPVGELVAYTHYDQSAR